MRPNRDRKANPSRGRVPPFNPPGQPRSPLVRGNDVSVSKTISFCEDGRMKHIIPVRSYHGVHGLLPARCLARKLSEEEKTCQGLSDLPAAGHPWPNRYLNWLAWFRERRARQGRSRRGRRRYRGFFFKGKSLYVRGDSGHIYDQRFLRTKHRSKIQRLSYTL